MRLLLALRFFFLGLRGIQIFLLVAVVISNRNRGAAEALAAEVTRDSGNKNVSTLDLDQASLASVTTCADALLRSHDKMDVLINYLGRMSMNEAITEDGFELQYAVNSLAPFLPTLRLLPALEAAAPPR